MSHPTHVFPARGSVCILPRRERLQHCKWRSSSARRCIVKFYGMGFRQDLTAGEAVDASSMYIVQEFMDGGTLKAKVLSQVSSTNACLRQSVPWMA